MMDVCVYLDSEQKSLVNTRGIQAKKKTLENDIYIARLESYFQP